MMSSDKVLGHHKHCTRCKGSKVDEIDIGYYYCAPCWLNKYANIKQQKRRSNYG